MQIRFPFLPLSFSLSLSLAPLWCEFLEFRNFKAQELKASLESWKNPERILGTRQETKRKKKKKKIKPPVVALVEVTPEVTETGNQPHSAILGPINSSDQNRYKNNIHALKQS